MGKENKEVLKLREELAAKDGEVKELEAKVKEAEDNAKKHKKKVDAVDDRFRAAEAAATAALNQGIDQHRDPSEEDAVASPRGGKTKWPRQAQLLKKRVDELTEQLRHEFDIRHAEEQRAKKLELRLAKVAEMHRQESKILKTEAQRRTDRRESLSLAVERATTFQQETSDRCAATKRSAEAFAAQIDRLGAILAESPGHLADAEILYDQGASVRGSIFGAHHAHHATTFHKLAAHCQSRNDLPSALAYFEKSVTQYEFSLDKGEKSPHSPSSPSFSESSSK